MTQHGDAMTAPADRMTHGFACPRLNDPPGICGVCNHNDRLDQIDWHRRALAADQESEARRVALLQVGEERRAEWMRAEKAEAACAALRHALELCVDHGHLDGLHEDADCPRDDTCRCPAISQINFADSFDAGRGYVRLDDVLAIVRADKVTGLLPATCEEIERKLRALGER